MARIIPKDETEAVSEKSFVGCVATITIGTASKGKPAQAKLRDRLGNTHYVMVEPDIDGQFFETGSEVLIVMQTGSVFTAIANSNPSLSKG